MQLRHAVVLHHASALTGNTSRFTTYYSFRNRLWLLFKNMPVPLMLFAIPANILCSLIIVACRRKVPARAALNGLWHGLWGLRTPLAKRRSVHAYRRLSTRSLARLFIWDPRQFYVRAVQPLPATLPSSEH